MMMKKISIILALFVLILNTKGQEVTESDIIKADKDLYIEDVNFKDWLKDSTASATAREAGSGITLDGNALDLGGTLNKDADILGAANSVALGTVGSKLNTFQVNATGDLTYNADGNIIFSANGVTWILVGSYWISSGGDTLASNAVVQELIDASAPQLPYNFEYTFSSTITDSRPGVGLFRFNNATIANVTEIYIDYFDANSVAKNNFLAMSDTGTVVSIITSDQLYALYKLTGGYIDNGNYYTYKVTYQSHNGVISGLSTIDIDMSNSTGTGGGGSDSTLISSTDTVTLIEDVLDAKGITIEAEAITATDNVDAATANVKLINLGTDNDYIDSNNIWLGGLGFDNKHFRLNLNPSGNSSLNTVLSDAANTKYSSIVISPNSYSISSFEDGETGSFSLNSTNSRYWHSLGSGNQVEIALNPLFSNGRLSLKNEVNNVDNYIFLDTADVRFQYNGIDNYKFTLDELSAENIDARFKNIYATDTVEAEVAILDTAKVEALIIGDSEPITGVSSSKFVMENTNTDKLQTDTIISETDSVTISDISNAVRKVLYPNDYASYLPNDSLYTTPSITLNTPTKVLIPTALKYTRNWAFFDKGGSDLALRYEGSDSSRFHITTTTSLSTSASNVVFEIFMYKNGVIETGIASERKIGTGSDVGSISITGAFDMDTNDYIEIFVLVDVTTTITFSKTSIVIKEDGLIGNPQ